MKCRWSVAEVSMNEVLGEFWSDIDKVSVSCMSLESTNVWNVGEMMVECWWSVSELFVKCW